MSKANSKVQMSVVNAELERCFAMLNKILWNNKLPHVVITIQSAGKKPALGWFWGTGWKLDRKNSIPEINISAEHMSRSALMIVETLIHEMCHLENFSNNIKDCSANQYHNKKFKDAAERVGLKVEKFKNKGWAFTELTSALVTIINAEVMPDERILSLARHWESKDKKKTGSKLKKWTCECGVNVRVAIPDFEATYNLCDTQFVCEEGDNEEEDEG